MSSVTRGPNYKGRIYSSDDLHAAGIILIDRRDFIRRRVLENYQGQASANILMSICREVEFLLTCNEQLFSDWEAGK